MRFKKITALLAAVSVTAASLYSITTQAGPVSAAEDHVVYVSGDGREGATGTKEDPFATIEEARDYLRTQNLDESNRGTVYIRQGVYYVTEDNPTVELEVEDSYVTYCAYEGEDVTISGTICLNNDRFKKLSEVSGEQYSSQSRVQDSMKDKLYVYDLGSEGIPVGEIIKNGFNWPKQPFQPELIVNDDVQTLAQYPNGTSKLSQSQILAGKTKNGQGEDATAKAAGANEGERPRNYYFDKTDEPKTYEEMLQMKGPVFYTRNGLQKRIGTWAPPTVEGEPQNNQPDVHVNTDNTKYETDGWLSGYFENDYANDMCRIYSVNTSKQTINCKYPSLQGVQDKRIQLKAVNLLCELDTTGEYYIDRYNGNDVLYYYPKNGTIEGKTVELTSSNAPFFRLEGASQIILKDISMTGSTGYGVILKDCHSCVIEGCEFSNISLDAVRIGENNNTITTDPSYTTAHGGQNNVVRNCLIHDMGGGGVYVAGGDEQTLQPGNHIVEHCEFYNISRLQTYTPAVYLEGVGNTARYNYIHNTPHMVIQIMGNDMLVTGNYIKDTCTNTSDQAPIYAGRCFNWLGNEISYNYIENVPSGCYGIYMDDGMSGMIIKNNIFKNVKGFAIFSNNGYGQQITDNIFINAKGLVTYKRFGTSSRPVSNEKVLKYRYYRVLREGNGSSYTNTKENIQTWYDHYKDLYPFLSAMTFPEENNKTWGSSTNSVFVPAHQKLERMVMVGGTASVDVAAVQDLQDSSFNTGHCKLSNVAQLGLDDATGHIGEDSALASKEGYGLSWIENWNRGFDLEHVGILEESQQVPSDKPEGTPTPTPEVTPTPGPEATPEATPTPTPEATPIPVLPGDVDGNGVVELGDAQLALKAALKLIRLDEKSIKAADVDGVDGVTLNDAQLILKKALKLI